MPRKGLRNLKYAKIEFDARVQLLYEVIEKKKSIGKTSKSLGICLSTAKLIVRKFKLSGEIFKKNGVVVHDFDQLNDRELMSEPSKPIIIEQISLQPIPQNTAGNRDYGAQVSQITPPEINSLDYYYIYYPWVTFQTV